jgi:hypothetical protein
LGRNFTPQTSHEAIGVKRALHCVTELAAASYGLRAPALA